MLMLKLESRLIDDTWRNGLAGMLMNNTEGNGIAVVFMVMYEIIYDVM